MKIGLIADIHADLKALIIALDILEGQGTDQVLCCGDLVEKGLDGDAVVSLIRERGIPTVLGNHDALAPDNQRWMRKHYSAINPMLLTDDTLAYLEQLPPELTFSWDGKQILMTHGTPRSTYEYLFPHSSRHLFEDVMQSCSCDVLLLGHTHQPMVALVGERWIFNPGSVCGGTAGGSGTCAVLRLPDMGFRVFEIRSGKRARPAFVHLETD